MAGIGKIIFRIMIVIIILLVAAIALIIGLSIAGNQTTVEVTTSGAVGQIKDSVILSCTFTPDTKESSDVVWEKEGLSGVVYKYQDGKISLTDQNSIFKGRTSLFLGQLGAGNASLQITGATLDDAGTYKCTITNSKGTGSNTLSLKVGAFSALTVTNASSSTLRCQSPSWYPPPTVTWLNATSGANLTNSSSISFVPGIGPTVEVISEFPGAVPGEQYTCIIQNNLAQAQGDARFTGSDFTLAMKSPTQLY
ncbi:V-set domain-containing T-cell activation inhibitor 1 [Gastrophryne carolinensis]